MTDPTRDLLISLASHMAYMQGQLEAHHQLDDLEDYYWFRESIALRQKVADALAGDSAAPAPPVDGEVAELVEWLQRQASASEAMGPFAVAWVPVAASERPWEREGWCDAEGNCWLGRTALGGSTPTWICGPAAWAERFPKLYRTLLPAHALPLPEVGE